MSKREIAAAAAKKYVLSPDNATANPPAGRYHSVITLITLGAWQGARPKKAKTSTAKNSCKRSSPSSSSSTRSSLSQKRSRIRNPSSSPFSTTSSSPSSSATTTAASHRRDPLQDRRSAARMHGRLSAHAHRARPRLQGHWQRRMSIHDRDYLWTAHTTGTTSGPRMVTHAS